MELSSFAISLKNGNWSALSTSIEFCPMPEGRIVNFKLIERLH